MGSPVSVTGGQFAHGLAQLVQAAEGSSDWIFSVTMVKNHIYWGYGQASQQISGRSGGAYHYPSSELRYSRAAGKLLEAFDVFGLKQPGANSEANSSPPCALDLGAAPGGWTGALVSKSFHVWAVDPSPLHPELTSQPQVKHLATTTDRLTSRDFSGRTFQLITCDANWDALAAQKAVLDLASHLVQGGDVLFTLKLIHSYGRIATHPPSVRAVNDMVAKTRDAFARVYRVKSIRQLFHNRAEISFHLQKL
jgi:23S rRNA (cytidine2498-2'-O)-methyltransferase